MRLLHGTRFIRTRIFPSFVQPRTQLSQPPRGGIGADVVVEGELLRGAAPRRHDLDLPGAGVLGGEGDPLPVGRDLREELEARVRREAVGPGRRRRRRARGRPRRRRRRRRRGRRGSGGDGPRAGRRRRGTAPGRPEGGAPRGSRRGARGGGVGPSWADSARRRPGRPFALRGSGPSSPKIPSTSARRNRWLF